jgi:ArsR family transcriptional regulator
MGCKNCKNSNCFKKLSSQARLDILDYLKEKSANVAELTNHLGIAQPSVSHHLKILSDYGFVTSKKEGRETKYSFNEQYPCKKCGIIHL